MITMMVWLSRIHMRIGGMSAPRMYVRSHYQRLYGLLDARHANLGAAPIQELITGSPGL
jgi:hypothetical protein